MLHVASWKHAITPNVKAPDAAVRPHDAPRSFHSRIDCSPGQTSRQSVLVLIRLLEAIFAMPEFRCIHQDAGEIVYDWLGSGRAQPGDSDSTGKYSPD